MSPVSNRDLKMARARFAYDTVMEWSARERDDATTRVQGLPIQVRTQGLLVTLAVLASNSVDETHNRKTVDDRLARSLTKWLVVEAPHHPLGHPLPTGRNSPTDLLGLLTNASRADCLAAQREAILLLDQIKIFVNALKGQEA